MKAHLMHPDRDFDLQQALPANAALLIQDLELETLVEAMAHGDPFVAEVSRKALLGGVANDLETICYRQEVLRDCAKLPVVAREIYMLAGKAIEAEKKHYRSIFRYPAETLRRSVEVIQMFVTVLRDLRDIAREHADAFGSRGWTTLFATLERELTDDYFTEIETQLKRLRFRNGMVMSAGLGGGNKAVGYVLRKPHDVDAGWFDQLFGPKPESHTYNLHPRDEAGARALSELHDRGLTLVANALAQSTAHILDFFAMLRTELAFYVGTLNLRTKMIRMDMMTCLPEPSPQGERRLAFRGLCDVCLALHKGEGIVGNDLEANGKSLIVITGANQGGKSTFLRSLGLAQLMMQAGMFVTADQFAGNLFSGVFTHYRREEDTTMKSGKFDEELSRMSDIIDGIRGSSLVLFNESFASTNEREGSEVGRQIVVPLLEQGTSVVFVTHMYDLAQSFAAMERPDALFLRAERHEGGERSFKLTEGEPLATSFGEDLYTRIFKSLAPDPQRAEHTEEAH